MFHTLVKYLRTSGIRLESFTKKLRCGCILLPLFGGKLRTLAAYTKLRWRLLTISISSNESATLHSPQAERVAPSCWHPHLDRLPNQSIKSYSLLIFFHTSCSAAARPSPAAEAHFFAWSHMLPSAPASPKPELSET